jgi:hypothetical protein
MTHAFDPNRTRQHEHSSYDTLIQYGGKYSRHSRDKIIAPAMRRLDGAIKKPEAAGTGAYIEVVTEADARLRMNENDLPGGRAMRHLVGSRSELQRQVTELVEQ